MLKITKLLEVLIATQKEINESIKELKEDIKPQWDKISTNADGIRIINNQLNNLETNVYTKEETVKTINKEYDYRESYNECKDENYALLKLIEKYCKYKDKYQVIDLFNEIEKEYLVETKL